MKIQAGTRLGPYEVTAPIGAGGMGEVYRARDTKLHRDVAIKVLPDAFASDLNRLMRFEREAQTLAALNHTNVAQVFGVLESPPALVMEFVPGEDLSSRIGRGPVPLEEARAIAAQIADALEAAHEQGIIHRDLKPANIKVRDDGTVKVLDFGLAKALSPDGSGAVPAAMHSPTFTAHATEIGMIIGTAAYMAPEQARGRPVDKRADIWAFGVVLYEMLAGARAFHGEDTSEILATVLKTEPDWGALPADTPASIRRLLRRCLEKDPRKRLSAMADARLEIDEREPSLASAAVPAAPPRWTSTLSLTAGVAIVAVLATVAMMKAIAPPSAPAGATEVTRLTMTLPAGDEVAEKHLLPLAISPDGSRVAYVATRDGVRRLFVRPLDASEPTALVGTEDARSPFFSPDGQWIGFFAQGKLKKAAVGSAAVQVVTANAPDPRGGAWGVDDSIYYAPTNVTGLWAVSASDGTPRQVTRLDRGRGEISHRWPEALPDGRLLFSSWTGPGPDEREIMLLTPGSGGRNAVLSFGDTPRYLPAGFLIYARLDTLLALPWRLSQASVGGGAPISLPEFPRLENEGAADYAVSTNGTLAYVAGGAARYAQRVVWVDGSGGIEPLPMPERDYEAVALSPDRKRAVVQIREGAMGLWLFDLERKTLTPFAASGGSSQAPVWTPDSRRIIYRGTRAGTRNLYWKFADGSGDEERLTIKEDVVQTPASVSPDGKWLVYGEAGGASVGAGVWAMRLNPDQGASPEARELVREAWNGQISPDGRWMAFQSATSGQLEVYVVPFPGPGPRVPVSVNGGENPLWSADGRELFYTNGNRMMAVAIAPGTAFSVSAPRQLFEGRYRPGSNSVTPFSVTTKDRVRFLRVQQVQPDLAVTRIEIVLNWIRQLRQPAPAK
jgi:eukaryotic-like serine/threonine-protein kinase